MVTTTLPCLFATPCGMVLTRMSKTSAESVPGLYCIYVVQRTTSVSVLTEVPQSRTMQRAHDEASGTPISSLNRCATIHSPSLRAKTLKKRGYLTMQSSVPKIKGTILGQAGNNRAERLDHTCNLEDAASSQQYPSCREISGQRRKFAKPQRP